MLNSNLIQKHKSKKVRILVEIVFFKLLLKPWNMPSFIFVSIGKVECIVFSQLSLLLLTKGRLFRNSVEDISRADLRSGLAFGCGERSPAALSASGDGRRTVGFCEGVDRFT